MKKFAMVLGAAVVAVVAGCKDPNYRRSGAATQNEPKSAGATVEEAKPAAPEVKTCTCAPGTKHTAPCTCGGENCTCIVVEAKPVAPAPVVAAAPEFSVYIVRHGDYLAKISKRFNVTIASIKRLNNMTKDTIRIGQKLKIPGKVDVGSAPAPQAAPAVKNGTVKSDKNAYAPYSGATKEYVVKSGDTLGSIAYGAGISIRQLKQLNGLSDNLLRVGQKLKVPASKQTKAAVVKPAEKTAEKPAEAKPQNDAVVAPPAEAQPAADTSAEAQPAEAMSAVGAALEVKPADAAADAAPAPATTTYVVQEGDDITAVSIRWGVSAADIRELNNLGDSDQLKPGQILKLPAEAQQ